MQIIKKFNNLHEELEFTNQKLESLWKEFQESTAECNNAKDDFDRERNDMYDTIYELSNQLKLKNLIIENFVPSEEYKKMEKLLCVFRGEAPLGFDAKGRFRLL